MKRNAYTLIALFLALIPAQAVVFNHLVLFNLAIPFVFILIIITLPISVSTNWATCLGFATGFALDCFCDTPGLNALACSTLAFMRRPVFHLYVTFDDDFSGQLLTSRSMGPAAYLKYMLSMAFLFCSLVFAIEAFQFFNLRLLMLRTISSTIFTFIFIYALDNLSFKQKK